MLVHGAAGGVGTASHPGREGRSARTPIAVVSTDEKEQVAREAGADEVVRSDGEWRDEAKELSGGGVDLVLDPGRRRSLHRLAALAAPRAAALVVVGFTAGSIPEVKVNRLLLNNTEVIGAGWGAYVIAQARAQPRDRRRDREADRLRARPAAGRRRASRSARRAPPRP